MMKAISKKSIIYRRSIIDHKNMQYQQSEKSQNVWSMGQILLAAYLAGPIGGCYLLGKNYKVLGYPAHSKKSYIFGLIGTIFLLALNYLISENFLIHIPPIAIITVYSTCIYSFARSSQKQLIEVKLREGSKRFSYWWCLLVALSLMVIQFPLLFFFSFVFDLFMNTFLNVG